MEDNRAEQIEALETLVEFNERVIKNIGILITELEGERLDDTDNFRDDIIKAVNWEIEVLNGTMEVLNEGKQRVDKQSVNEKIIALNDAVTSEEDGKLAEAFRNLLPELRALGTAAEEVIA